MRAPFVQGLVQKESSSACHKEPVAWRYGRKACGKGKQHVSGGNGEMEDSMWMLWYLPGFLLFIVEVLEVWAGFGAVVCIFWRGSAKSWLAKWKEHDREGRWAIGRKQKHREGRRGRKGQRGTWSCRQDDAAVFDLNWGTDPVHFNTRIRAVWEAIEVII